jgi:hypothetical protein
MATSAESVSILLDAPFDRLSKVMQAFGAPSPPAVNQAPLPRENEAIGASIRENSLPWPWPN